MTMRTSEENNVRRWKMDILNALEEKGDISWEKSLSNKDLMEHVAANVLTYNYLNERGLVNRGFCPISGDSNLTGKYNSYGRIIYLSEKVNIKASVPTTVKSGNSDKSARLLITIVCALISYFIVKPKAGWDFLWLFLTWAILNFIINFLYLEFIILRRKKNI